MLDDCDNKVLSSSFGTHKSKVVLSKKEKMKNYFLKSFFLFRTISLKNFA